MIALHFGAGKIGRGFIGAVLRRAGLDVVFADVDERIVGLINREGGYTVHVMDTVCRDEEVRGMRAVLLPEAADLIPEADLVTTAVSVKFLPGVAPVIAEGIRRRRDAWRREPLTVIACENGVRATSMLKGMVFESLDVTDRIWAESHVAFADCSVDRIVPPIACEKPLDVAVEEFYEWNVDRTRLISGLPPVPGMHLTDDLLSHIERKLYTLNTGHCSTAYFGALKGYTYIYEALDDPSVLADVRGVMGESSEALIRKFSLDPREQYAYIDRILSRFRNPYLKDTVARVGRDPLRKLSAPLYFAYPLEMAAGFGLPTAHLCRAAAAALRFNRPDDPQCARIQELIATFGLEGAISEIMSLSTPGLVRAVADAYKTIVP